MSKRTRQIVGLLMGLLMILSVVAPATAMAVENSTPPPSSNARPETGNLYLHKLQFNDAEFFDDLITNDGLTQTPPAESFPLEDVEFTIYPVSDDIISPVDIPASELGDPLSGRTDVNGNLSFMNLTAGRYYVVETDTPDGVEVFSPPFLVDVPMMHPDGDKWNTDVHVYPKNQLILGAVELIKYDEDGESGLPGAQFDFYKGIPDEGVYIESFTTNADGKIFVGELVTGNYYFVETAAPDGYGLNDTPITFIVGLGDHAYTSGNDSDSLDGNKVIRDGIELTNFLLPAKIDKYVTAIDNKVETANFGEDIKWIIVSEVPSDIETYNYYRLVDTFGPEMTFNNDVIINDGDIDAEDFDVTFFDNVLTIDIEPSALIGLSELIVEFSTYFNDTTIMGRDYFNNVDLEFDSGFVSDTISAENPPYAHTGGKPFMKEDNNDNPLNGAEFVIYNKSGFYLQPDYSWGDKASAWVFISGDGEDTPDGYFEIKGLAYGDYYLEETKAPKVGDIQYRLLDNDVMFTVDANSYYTDPTLIELPDADPTADPALIENKPEITLPQTGGVGTLIFSIIGLGLMGSSVKLYKKSEK